MSGCCFCVFFFILCACYMFPLQDSGFLDGAFESQNAALVSLSRLLYDELVKSILRIVEKLDLSVQKVTTGEEVRRQALQQFTSLAFMKCHLQDSTRQQPFHFLIA